mmetsp:Transcript_95753/g.222042  ORF Transcript_95753/g.222042 Transcript_95753/m.222042 type:complete len:232 (+) Transcript_95753:88-783(+)
MHADSESVRLHLERIAGVVQRGQTFFESSHHIVERGRRQHFELPDPDDIPPHLHTGDCCWTAWKDRFNFNGSPVLELDTDGALQEVERLPLVALSVFGKLDRQGPESEILHVVVKLAVDLLKIRVVVELLVSNPCEFPAILDTQLLLGVAVDGKVVGDDGSNELVLDTQGPPLGIHCPDDSVLIFEVQAETVRSGLFDWFFNYRRRHPLQLNWGNYVFEAETVGLGLFDWN